MQRKVSYQVKLSQILYKNVDHFYVTWTSESVIFFCQELYAV